MEQNTPALIKVRPLAMQSTEEVLRENLTDNDKYQTLYYDILENKTLGED